MTEKASAQEERCFFTARLLQEVCQLSRNKSIQAFAFILY